jgi:hypothetical protein
MIQCWSAWTPEMDQQPSTPAVAKAFQRRLSPLARAVLHCIGECIHPAEHLPTVFSSSHGEIGKCLEMLETLQAGEELSPTAFSLSVHNAIAGLYSMAYGNHAEITALAPAAAGLGAGFIEALGILQEGQPEALLVFYDEALPDFFPSAPFNMSLTGSCVLALKLALVGEGIKLSFGLSQNTRHDGEQPLQLPALIKFLNSEQSVLCLGDQGCNWQWQKL